MGINTVNDGEVLVVVHGFTGVGKSAVAGEIEILCKALGLEVRWENGDEEKFLTHADWTAALGLYKPRVRIVEVNAPRAAGSALTITVKSERITSEYTRCSAPAVTCTWTLDPIDESWDTGCGEKHQFTDGGPSENSHRFCPYCSGALRAALESLDV